jgi:hypothetical protein
LDLSVALAGVKAESIAFEETGESPVSSKAMHSYRLQPGVWESSMPQQLLLSAFICVHHCYIFFFIP